MAAFETFAFLACLSSLGAKTLFSVKISHLKKQAKNEREQLTVAKKELNQAQQQVRLLDVEQKQLEAQRKALQRNISQADQVYQSFVNQEKIEEAAWNQQKALLEESRRKGH
ncbi:MAG: hypothetical protein O2954_17190 [bacterium]|nr:hypothetical protein [bacterium]